MLREAPELNLRAERAKPCGLKTSPEGALLSQRGVFSPARPAKWHILGQEVQLRGVLSLKILRNSNDALRGRKIIYAVVPFSCRFEAKLRWVVTGTQKTRFLVAALLGMTHHGQVG